MKKENMYVSKFFFAFLHTCIFSKTIFNYQEKNRFISAVLAQKRPFIENRSTHPYCKEKQPCLLRRQLQSHKRLRSLNPSNSQHIFVLYFS